MQYVPEMIKFGVMLAAGLIGLMIVASVIFAAVDHPRRTVTANAVVAEADSARVRHQPALQGTALRRRPVTRQATANPPPLVAEEIDEGLEIAEMLWSAVAAEADCLISFLEAAAPGTQVRLAGQVVRVQEAWGYGGLLCELSDGSDCAPLWFPADQDALPHEGQMIVVSGRTARGRRMGVKVNSWYDPLVA